MGRGERRGQWRGRGDGKREKRGGRGRGRGGNEGREKREEGEKSIYLYALLTGGSRRLYWEEGCAREAGLKACPLLFSSKRAALILALVWYLLSLLVGGGWDAGGELTSK